VVSGSFGGKQHRIFLLYMIFLEIFLHTFSLFGNRNMFLKGDLNILVCFYIKEQEEYK
jgi:hypothetical protein